ncbi:MAG: DoxX family membrane protein [Actinomycetota bacterium]
MDVFVLVARVLFVMIFLSSGLFGHLGPGRPMLTGFAEARKLPAASFLVPFSGLWIVLGSISVLLGIYGDVGALMLALFVIGTALLMHPFWKETEEQSKMQEQVQFNKDLALAGGAIGFFALFAALGGDLGLTITGALFEL